jgi:hypothetical protein
MSMLTQFARWWTRTNPPTQSPKRHRQPVRFKPRVEALEDRQLLASTITAAFGAGPGGGPEVTVVFDDNTSTNFMAVDPRFTGGVSAVLGHLAGSIVPDVIVGAGRGAGSSVAVFSGTQLVAGTVEPIASFLAFPVGFTGGVTLAAGRVNGTNHDDVIVGAGPGGGPEVEVFDGVQLNLGNPVATAAFMAFRSDFNGGVTLAAGNVNGTSHADVIVGAGPGGSSGVAVYDGAQLAHANAVATASFLAFAPGFGGGVMLAAGNVNGTGHADVIAAAGPGGGPQVQVYDGAQLAHGNAVATASFMAFDPAFTGGVSIAVGNFLGDPNHLDIAVGAGPGGGPQVIIFDGAKLAQGQVDPPVTFLAFDPAFTGGVQVGVAHNDITGEDILTTAAGPGGGPQVNFYNPTMLVVHNFVPFYSFFAFSFVFTGGVAFGSYCSPFFSSPLDSAFVAPNPFSGGWFDTGTTFGDPFVGDVVSNGTLVDNFFAPDYFDPGFVDPSFVDPGCGCDPGFMDPGFVDPSYFDPGYMDPGSFDPGLGGFDSGFDGGGSDFGGSDGGS